MVCHCFIAETPPHTLCRDGSSFSWKSVFWFLSRIYNICSGHKFSSYIADNSLSKLSTLTVSWQFSISAWSSVRWSSNFLSSKKYIVLCVVADCLWKLLAIRLSSAFESWMFECHSPSYKLCSHGISFVSACESSGSWAQVSTVLGKYVGHWSILVEMRLPIAVCRTVFDLFRLSLPRLVIPKFHLRKWQLDYPGCCVTMRVLA